jgi:hypothetical protein
VAANDVPTTIAAVSALLAHVDGMHAGEIALPKVRAVGISHWTTK